VPREARPEPFSGVEPDPDRVHGPQDEPTPATVAVGAIELASDEIDRQ
jgi:hypothetical protein